MGRDLEVKERKRSSSKKSNRHRREKKNSNYDSYESSSDEESNYKLKKSSKRTKTRYSSDSHGSFTSESEDERRRVSRKHERNHKKGRKSKKVMTREDSSDDNSSFSSESEDERRRGVSRKRERNHKKGRKGKEVMAREDSSDDSRGSDPQDDKELVRREMGLEWMVKPSSNPAKMPTEINVSLEETQVEEVKKSNPRELNPYLKDDGSGYPEDLHPTKDSGNQLMPSSVVGDGGASWRLKALKRAQEQASREGRKLQEVVEERWGSVGHLAVSAAKSRAAPARAHLNAIKDRKRGVMEKQETFSDDNSNRNNEKVHSGKREHLRDVSSRHSEMREPKVHDSLSWRKRKSQNISTEDTRLISAAASSINKFENDGSFMREVTHQQSTDAGSSHKNSEGTEHTELDLVSSSISKHREESPIIKQTLSANQLAAKAMQLRMKGKHEEAEKLMKEAEIVRMTQDSGSKLASQGTERRASTYVMKDVSVQQKKKEDDVDIHLAQKIVQNKKYSLSGRADDEYDFDDDPSRKKNRKRGGVPEKLSENRNIMKGIMTQQERCQFCFENPTRPRHLVVSIANFTYLMLPQLQSIVEGHCCILPMQHESATRNIDNDVWEEIRNFKKCLIMMFGKQEKDVVFLETVMGLARQRRHCLVECIPLPRDIARQAPLYFKKAIDEAEEEWSQHNAKKLIDTTEKGLRGSIPKNFPYFFVEFGLDRGFVHVIDDEKHFKSSLGLDVIRGMLQLPEEDMHRRRRHESLETQKQAVASFAREWAPFDWTKQLD